MSSIAFKVNKNAEKAIRKGHPWVFENSIIKQNKEGKAGDTAIIFEQRNNQLLAIGLYDPDSTIRIRVLHVGSSTKLDASFFRSKIGQAYLKRKPIFQTETTAYRLVYGENDGFSGLIIDIYNDKAVLKLYSEVWFEYLDILSKILVDLLNLSGIALRLNRKLQSGESEFKDGSIIYGELLEEEVTFLEHGLKFNANLLKGHKTGYFLDHRHNRLLIRGLAKNCSVLDVFAYAGGFSVNAVAGGASKVISVDISAQALELAKKNVALNFSRARHEVLVKDAFKALENFNDSGDRFDLIVIDPPSFAKSGEQVKGALKSYERLVRLGIKLVLPKGLFVMCSCSSRIGAEEFFELVEKIARSSLRPYKVIHKTTHDIDHPEGIPELSYLKSIYVAFQ